MEATGLIQILADTFGMLVAVIGGGFVLMKLFAKKAYDQGAHDAEHKELWDDLNNLGEAHRDVRGRVESLEKSNAANMESHKALIDNQAKMDKKIDQILAALIKR